MTRVAVIDVGTVTARLAIADVESGSVVRMARQSQIVNLGEGVDASGVLKEEACARLLACLDGYLAQIREARVPIVCCTLTSAARDARNSGDLLGELERRGLVAQVIPGEVEAMLTFLGVAQDFPNTKLLVADNGGGSTEFALGMFDRASGLAMERVKSIDVGCRRITEKFLSREDPPSADDLTAAHGFAADAFAGVASWWGDAEAPARLVLTGGTSTTLVAIKKELVPYDSAQVHLATLSVGEIEELEAKLASITAAERAELPGIQVKRAPVILGGAVAVSEAARMAGLGGITVSESDLLFGLAIVTAATADGEESPVGWRPSLH